MRQALPFDVELGDAGLGVGSRQVDLLDRPGAQARPPRARHWQGLGHPIRGRRHPHPVVVVINPRALGLFEAGERDVGPAQEGAREACVGVPSRSEAGRGPRAGAARTDGAPHRYTRRGKAPGSSGPRRTKPGRIDRQHPWRWRPSCPWAGRPDPRPAAYLPRARRCVASPPWQTPPRPAGGCERVGICWRAVGPVSVLCWAAPGKQLRTAHSVRAVATLFYPPPRGAAQGPCQPAGDRRRPCRWRPS